MDTIKTMHKSLHSDILYVHYNTEENMEEMCCDIDYMLGKFSATLNKKMGGETVFTQKLLANNYKGMASNTLI